MNIDNLDLIIPLLKFESEDDFYYLQILQRKKENPGLGSNSRVIKNYYITSVEYLLKHYEEIKTLCHTFNARAMIRLNKRSFEKVAFKALVNVSNSISNREYSFIKKSYDRACGDGHNENKNNVTWILDFDNVTLKDIVSYVDFVNKQESSHNQNIVAVVPSKNGFHIITKRFDIRNVTTKFNIDIQKDNPTNLYIPQK